MLVIDHALAQRLERNDAHHLADYAHTLAQLGLAHTWARPIADGIAAFTGSGSPINRVGGLGMNSAITTDDLDLIEWWYAEAGLPAQVDVCPLADGSLIELLHQRGYAITRLLNVHVLPLARANASETADHAVGVVLADRADAKLWVRTAAAGFAARDDLTGDDWHTRLAQVAFDRPGSRCFLARIDGEPAGAGSMIMRDGLATLFSTGVRAQFRRRGVQTALIQARLAAAAVADCDLATSLTAPGSGSERNMQRIGFQVLYTRPTVQQPGP